MSLGPEPPNLKPLVVGSLDLVGLLYGLGFMGLKMGDRGAEPPSIDLKQKASEA